MIFELNSSNSSVEHNGSSQDSCSLSETLVSNSNESSDSFSSDPGTNFNRGTAQFLTLLEPALARRQEAEHALKFE